MSLSLNNINNINRFDTSSFESIGFDVKTVVVISSKTMRSMKSADLDFMMNLIESTSMLNKLNKLVNKRLSLAESQAKLAKWKTEERFAVIENKIEDAVEKAVLKLAPSIAEKVKSKSLTIINKDAEGKTEVILGASSVAMTHEEYESLSNTAMEFGTAFLAHAYSQNEAVKNSSLKATPTQPLARAEKDRAKTEGADKKHEPKPVVFSAEEEVIVEQSSRSLDLARKLDSHEKEYAQDRIDARKARHARWEAKSEKISTHNHAHIKAQRTH